MFGLVSSDVSVSHRRPVRPFVGGGRSRLPLDRERKRSEYARGSRAPMNDRLLFFLTLRRRTPAGTFAMQPGRGLRGDHVLGGTIGFLLVSIARLADAQPGPAARPIPATAASPGCPQHAVRRRHLVKGPKLPATRGPPEPAQPGRTDSSRLLFPTSCLDAGC